MKHYSINLFLILPLLTIQAQDSPVPCRVFSFEQNISLPGCPEKVYDAVTGEISPWWHLFLFERLGPYLEKRSE